MRRIVRVETAAGGAILHVETPAAYANGESRFETVFLPADKYREKTRAEIVDAVIEVMADEATIATFNLPAVAPRTKDTVEERLHRAGDRWAKWDRYRAEAVRRGSPATVVNAFTNRTNALWARVEEVLTEWRTV
ncbi:MAG: hypothetical protein H0U59_11085 [Gemmatimonadaceae bacterium]|nr:hypothetical protein [Gemmatimonadaceae bacterium]